MNVQIGKYEVVSAAWRTPDHQEVVLSCAKGGTVTVGADPSNRHYQEIMRLVDAGELTIQEPSE